MKPLLSLAPREDGRGGLRSSLMIDKISATEPKRERQRDGEIIGILILEHCKNIMAICMSCMMSEEPYGDFAKAVVLSM